MDIIKVHYDEELQGVYGDDCRYFFDVAGKSLGEEVVKRINMHDELVAVLKRISAMCDMDGGSAIDELLDMQNDVLSLLERCK